MTKKEKGRREAIERYKRELLPLAEDVDDEQRKALLLNLIDKVAYQTAMLDEIQEDTIVHGVTVKYNNGGGQSGVRISPSVQVYTQYAKLLHAYLRQFRDYLPETAEGEDALKSFIEAHDSA